METHIPTRNVMSFISQYIIETHIPTRNVISVIQSSQMIESAQIPSSRKLNMESSSV